MKALRDRLEAALLEACPDSRVNGDTEARLPNTTNISFEYIEGEAILLLLDRFGICASSGSACTSGSLEPSHVLRAMGVPFTAAHGSIRFSLSRYNTAGRGRFHHREDAPDHQPPPRALPLRPGQRGKPLIRGSTLTLSKWGVAGVEHRAWVPRINSFIRAPSESCPIPRARTNKLVRATLRVPFPRRWLPPGFQRLLEGGRISEITREPVLTGRSYEHMLIMICEKGMLPCQDLAVCDTSDSRRTPVFSGRQAYRLRPRAGDANVGRGRGPAAGGPQRALPGPGGPRDGNLQADVCPNHRGGPAESGGGPHSRKSSASGRRRRTSEGPDARRREGGTGQETRSVWLRTSP